MNVSQCVFVCQWMHASLSSAGPWMQCDLSEETSENTTFEIPKRTKVVFSLVSYDKSSDACVWITCAAIVLVCCDPSDVCASIVCTANVVLGICPLLHNLFCVLSVEQEDLRAVKRGN